MALIARPKRRRTQDKAADLEEMLACNPGHLQKLGEDAYNSLPSTPVCRMCSQASGKVQYVQLESPGGTCVAEAHCPRA